MTSYFLVAAAMLALLESCQRLLKHEHNDVCTLKSGNVLGKCIQNYNKNTATKNS